ncbi:MAG TPA: hypothetical protein VF228_25635 [Iamia sp.]
MEGRVGACPVCTGDDRVEIAPGYYECTSTVYGTAPGPGYGAPPTGQFGPQLVTTSGVCGHRYQEGTSMSSSPLGCTAPGCGYFAVGRCAQCGDPVCGQHLGNHEGTSLCPTHLTEARATAQARAREERASVAAARAEQHRREQAEAEADLAGLLRSATAAGRRGPVALWDAPLLRNHDGNGYRDPTRREQQDPHWRAWPVLEEMPAARSRRSAFKEFRPSYLADDGTFLRSVEGEPFFAEPAAPPDDDLVPLVRELASRAQHEGWGRLSPARRAREGEAAWRTVEAFLAAAETQGLPPAGVWDESLATDDRGRARQLTRRERRQPTWRGWEVVSAGLKDDPPTVYLLPGGSWVMETRRNSPGVPMGRLAAPPRDMAAAAQRLRRIADEAGWRIDWP